MTLAARITYLTALFIGISVGVFFGYRNRIHILREYGQSRFTIAPFALENFSKDQYIYADSEHAQRALLTCANLLEEMERAKPEKTMGFELNLAYTHLALLADKTNNAEESQAYMTKAQYWYRAAGGQDHSDADMKAAVMRRDDLLGLNRRKVEPQ